jgi:hypothetical protein
VKKLNTKTLTEDKINYIKTLISFLERKKEDPPIFILAVMEEGYKYAMEEIIKTLKLDIETLEKHL